MSKSKNHTAKNQTNKDHRNGIKRVQKNKYTSQLGMDPKYLRCLKRARANGQNKKTVKKN